MADTNYFRGTSSDCHSHGQADMDWRLRHSHPMLSTRTQPSVYQSTNFELPYEHSPHGYSSPDLRSFRMQKRHHDPASDFRVWQSPSQAEYDNRERLSWRLGMFHNGGRSPLGEPSNSNMTFSPMLNERLALFEGDAPASSSRYDIYSNSSVAVPATGACRPATSLRRNSLSEHHGVHIEEIESTKNQITLHKWFLIRAPNIDASTTNNMKYIEVCLGGLVRSGPQHSQLVRTSVVVERLEKCKLRALDGTEICLVGFIDEQKTIANGFPVSVANTFLTGFPGNWRHLLTKTLATAPPHGPPIEFDNYECLSHCKSEGLDSDFRRSTGFKVSQPRNISPGLCSSPCPEMSHEGQERAEYGFGDGVSKPYSNYIQNAELEYMDHTKSKDERCVPCGPVSYIDRKSLSELYDGDSPLDLKRKSVVASEHFVDGKVNNEAGSLKLVTDSDVACHVVVIDVDDETLPDVAASPVSNGGDTFNESQGVSHNNDKIAKSLNRKNVSARARCSNDPNIEHDVQVGDPVSKTDPSSCTHVLEDKGNGVEATPVDFISHNISKAQDISFATKRRYSKRLRKEEPECEEGIKLADESFDLGQRVKRKEICSKASKRYREPIKEKCSVRSKQQDDCVDRGKAMDLKKSVKHQTKKSKASAKHARNEVSDRLGPSHDYEAGHHKGHIGTVASTPKEDEASKSHGVPSLPIEHVESPKMSCHGRHRRSTSKQIQAQPKSTPKSSHNKSSIMPPPLPSPRVNVSKNQIMRAYGLKMSRSGRILVPPLAYWRNQTLAHDMDGTIIAIWEGFDEHPADTGCYNFKPPVEKLAVNLQEELCAAAKVIPNRSKNKKR